MSLRRTRVAIIALINLDARRIRKRHAVNLNVRDRKRITFVIGDAEQKLRLGNLQGGVFLHVNLAAAGNRRVVDHRHVDIEGARGVGGVMRGNRQGV